MGGEELRALALLDIGDTETWTGRLDQAESHLEQAVALARRIGRPYLEFMSLTYRAEIELNRWLPRAAELSRQAIDLAERNGWTEMRVAAAVLRLTQDDPHGATVALAPVLDGSARVGWRSWLVEAFLLEAIARDALGDQAAAGGALERALDLA